MYAWHLIDSIATIEILPIALIATNSYIVKGDYVTTKRGIYPIWS